MGILDDMDYGMEERLLSYARGARRIADVGCGSGELVEHLCRATDAEVTGIDLYAAGRPFSRRCRFVSLDIERADSGTLASIGGFDLIYFLRSLHHMRSPVRALTHICSMLSPAGRLILMDWKHGAQTDAPWESYFHVREFRDFLRRACPHHQIVEEFTSERLYTAVVR